MDREITAAAHHTHRQNREDNQRRNDQQSKQENNMPIIYRFRKCVRQHLIKTTKSKNEG